jgi:hypothetical protein
MREDVMSARQQSKQQRKQQRGEQTRQPSMTPTDAPTDAPTNAATERLPRDPRTGQPLAPRRQPGYYPGFSTLSQQAFWDDATRAVVRKRVEQPPAITYFDEAEARVMEAVCACVLPQDDRTPDRRIPILNVIDERLASGRINGYRYDDMPPDAEAYRLAIQAIEGMARALGAESFTALSLRQQEELLESLHEGQPLAGGEEFWRRMNVRRFWLMLVSDCASAYYAHPWAWDEIGFGGPAYPRGYMRLRDGQPEPWEKAEHRYEWASPPASHSESAESLSETPEAASFTPGSH